jgi:hypothetical protein
MMAGSLPLWWLDMALLLLLAEALGRAWRARRGGPGLRPRDWVWTLLAGGALLAAMRAALGGVPLPGVAACLAVAGLCHVIDLRSRRRAQVPRAMAE